MKKSVYHSSLLAPIRCRTKLFCEIARQVNAQVACRAHHRLGAVARVRTMLISGGEPTCHPEWKRILDYSTRNPASAAKSRSAIESVWPLSGQSLRLARCRPRVLTLRVLAAPSGARNGLRPSRTCTSLSSIHEKASRHTRTLSLASQGRGGLLLLAEENVWLE